MLFLYWYFFKGGIKCHLQGHLKSMQPGKCAICDKYYDLDPWSRDGGGDEYTSDLSTLNKKE
jgi:hypothetical protein